jgi:hypothetical protein
LAAASGEIWVVDDGPVAAISRPSSALSLCSTGALRATPSLAALALSITVVTPRPS